LNGFVLKKAHSAPVGGGLNGPLKISSDLVAVKTSKFLSSEKRTLK
jgi:hypothetical protein